jgi:hypothetical protein
MTTEKALLLVEGEADKSFFTEVCSRLFSEPHIQVEVALTRDMGGRSNTKQGIYNHLNILLRQQADGDIKQLAVVIDADYESVNLPDGFNNTVSKITTIVEPYGFTLKQDQTLFSGLVFENDNGLSDFGLWVMPNNRDEGMLENFIKVCVKTDEQPLFDYAVQVVQTVPEPKKFKQHHYSKAEVATWLAWQKKPGHGLYHVLGDDLLLDTDHALFKKLERWLKQIFI